MRLRGKRAVVTGGTSGLGQAIATMFGDEGASFVSASRSCEVLETPPAADAPLVFDQVEACDEESVRAFMGRVNDRWGRLDILVTSAGMMFDGQVEHLAPAEMQAMFATNVMGTLLTVQAALPLMRAGRGGVIIIMSSAITGAATVGTGGYRATIAAVEAISETLAVEVASHGIRVNSLAAGFTTRGLSLPLIENADLWARYESYIALRRAAELREIASNAVFLASDDAKYVVGHVLRVDGGFRWP